MIYIGIDPGVHGGIAVIRDDEVRARPMPETDRELLAFLMPYRPVVDRAPGGWRPIAFAVLERVWGMPGWGARNFPFGVSYGGSRMALAGMRIPFEEAIPQRWQKIMGVTYPKRPAGSKPVKRDKNISKRRAEALFPQLTITHAIADALLIADFCRRLHGGTYGKENGGASFGLNVEEVQQSKSELAEVRGSRGKTKAGAAVAGVTRHGAGATRQTRSLR